MKGLVVAACVVTPAPVVMLSSGCGERSPGDSHPHRICAALSLSGPYAGPGEPERRVTEAGLEHLNEAVATPGRPVELLPEGCSWALAEEDR